VGDVSGARILVLALPYWGHLSACLGLAGAMAARGATATFGFAFPPPRWVLDEISGHGHRSDWSLRHVRSALGSPARAEQWRAIVAAESELIRACRPDVVVNDISTTAPAAARACGVPVASIQRCPLTWWREALGDVQLVPHPGSWLPLPAPGVVHCRLDGARRLGMAPAPIEPCPVVAALNTADAEPAALRLVLDAFEGLDHEWVVCYAHPDAVAASPRIVAWADHDALLAGARVLVCHGGHGLIARAIRHGVPVVVVETEEAYPAVYGAALEAAGAGILVRRRDQTPRAVRSAAVRAMDDPTLRDGAARLRRSFEALPPVADALSRWLEERACA
jgi:UDP:flavonoid glycosyltransferase YjiC (YdhE family)